MEFRTSFGRVYRLELAFNDLSLRTICEDEAHAGNELGPNVAKALKRRLADLRAATSVKDLVVGRPRELAGTDKQMFIDVGDDHQLVFCANHPKNPLTGTGELDWLKVSRIKVLRIEKQP